MEISKLDRGAQRMSGSCWRSFIWSMEDEELELAFVRVFIIMSPGRINNV